MSVFAYGSLVSLMQVLDQIQKHHAWGRIRLDVQQVQNFKDKIQFLQEFLELDSQKLSEGNIEGLAWGITDAVREAEIIIDRYVVDQLGGHYDDENDKGLSAFRVALEDVVQVMDTIKEGLINQIQFVQPNRKSPPLSIHSNPTTSSSQAVMTSLATPSTIESSKMRRSMVGFAHRINQIVDKLTNDEKSLQVIPISGMGGIGKTTLARCVFADSRIVNRFDRLKWSTISQEYNEQEVILGLLDEKKSDLPKKKDEKKSDRVKPELGVQLHQELKSRRYLIVIDDMWNIEVWDRLKLFFPNDCNGSRVIVTTRLSNVANSLGSSYSYQLDFLNDDESWVLFCEKAFGQQSCPANLEEFGKKIVRSCRGLPISIVTIGGLLSKSDMTPEYWEFVAQNATQITSSGDDERCLKILYLSYDNLPIHLKLCFLDFENYPEDGIRASELIHNWISLGLVKSASGQRIEDIAEGNLNELTNRNLIFVRDRKYSGEIKSYGIHDLLRELCIKESEQENLIHNTRSRSLKREILLWGKKITTSDDQCFMCDASKGVDAMEMVPASRSTTGIRHSRSSGYVPSFCGGCKMEYSHLKRWRWVKLLVYYGDMLFWHPTQVRIFQHHSGGTLCRYYSSPSPILFLWNLQIIDIMPLRMDPILLPIEIWEMQQLRHLTAPWYDLPDPAIGEKDQLAVLEELHTLEYLKVRLTVERMPNIRVLKIGYPDKYVGDNMSFFTQLESLTLSIGNMKDIIFPHTLKKLHLMSCYLCREDMDVIGSLPNLQVLNLETCFFEGDIWIPTEGKFLQLKVLKIQRVSLRCWEAEQDHFPKLERLFLKYMDGMKEIPSDIAHIPTLLSIDLIICSKKVIESAKRILVEQQSLGNYVLKIYVRDGMGQSKVVKMELI